MCQVKYTIRYQVSIIVYISGGWSQALLGSSVLSGHEYN